MTHLYVCHFSNGHIKVGRSIDPVSRIASHEARVACFGIELVEHHIVECVGPSIARERQLISFCITYATERNLNEWFSGLDYPSVVQMANDLAAQPVVGNDIPRDSFGFRLSTLRRAAELTQEQLGKNLCGADAPKAVISSWENNRHHPSLSQFRELCVRLNVSADYLLSGGEHITPETTQ